MSESENSGGQFIELQKEGESEVRTANPTDVSEGNQGSSDGGAELRDDQRQQTTGDSGTESRGGHNAYPLPSEQGDRERAAEEQKEQDSNQQQSSEQQSSEQQSSGDSGSGGEQKQESSGEQKQEESSGGDDSQKKDDDDDSKGNEKKGSKPGASRENPDSIPTAGGERLGEKHWGESQMVPDVPKTQQEKEKENVSSAEGQPDQQTKDNTARNTGEASGEGDQGAGEGEGEGEGKVGMVDKIKDKLGLAGK